MCFLAAKVFMATFLAFKEDTKNRKNPYPPISEIVTFRDNFCFILSKNMIHSLDLLI